MKSRLVFWIVLLSSMRMSALENTIELCANLHAHLYPGLMKTMRNCFGTDVLIETGTLQGDCAYSASPYFRAIHTVELAPQLYHRARKRVRSCPNVHCYLGDSSLMLLPMIEKDSGTILFWLDAHYSGGETALGVNGDPILFELDQIGKSRRFESVILIDDIRGHDIPLIVTRMREIDEDFACYIIGDILLAFNTRYHAPTISPLVQALTISRASKEISEIVEAEDYILYSENSREKEMLSELYRQYLGVYGFWEGLIQLGKKNYKEAVAALLEARGHRESTPWRINCYLVRAYHESGAFPEAKKTFALLAPYLEEHGEAIRLIMKDTLFETYRSI